jgi:hypothetical protein
MSSEFGGKSKVFSFHSPVTFVRFSYLYTNDKKRPKLKGNKKVKAKWEISFGFLIVCTSLKLYLDRLLQTFERKAQGI